ncbi:MAG TPA: substrate-binding domain-containing protein [Planctomycetota bacterium]|jgi:ribose transport system substrate-binding protein|nr:substrate-binding domain-containing protein [Planctomycetota bacterium]
MGLRSPLLAVLLPLGACGRGGDAPLVGVVPKGVTHEFWKAIHLGAESAAKEFGGEVRWAGPSDETKVTEQLQIVEDLLSAGVKGLVLAPIHKVQSRKAVEDARAKGVPVAIIDSAVDAEGILTFAATDNRLGGALAAEEMGRALGGKGKVAVLLCKAGSASTEDREAGFRETVRSKFPGIEIVDEQYGQSVRQTSVQVARDLLAKHPDLDGFFGSNESSAYGVLVALRGSARAGKVVAIGFDSAEELLDGLREGVLRALVVQNPFRMGYEGVKAVMRSLRGEAVPPRIDTGVTLVTRERLGEPEIEALLHPRKG